MKYNTKTLTQIYQRIVGAMSGIPDVQVILDDTSPCFSPDTKQLHSFRIVPYADDDEDDFNIGRGIIVHEAGHVIFCPPMNILINELIEDGWDRDDINEYLEWLNVFLDANNEYKTGELWNHLKQPLIHKANRFFEKKPKVLGTSNPMLQVLIRIDHFKTGRKAIYPKNYVYKDFVEWTLKFCDQEKMLTLGYDSLTIFTHKVFQEWKKTKKELENKGLSAMKEIDELCKKQGKAIKAGRMKEYEELKKKAEELNKANANPGEYDKEIAPALMTKTKGGLPHDYNNKTLEELKKMLEEKVDRAKNSLVKGVPAWGNDFEPDQDFVTQKVDDIEEMSGDEVDKIEAYKNGKRINRALKAKVELQKSYENNHRNGRIDINNVRNQISKNGKLTNERLFQRTNCFTRGGEWAIEVLLDCSGSMMGDKMTEAKQAFATLAYAFDGLPNVKYALTGFSTEGNNTSEIIIKSFGQRRFKIEKLNKLDAYSGNRDGYNIRASVKRLRKFNNMKKVLVVISDGQPAYYKGIDDVKEVVKKAKNMGIEVLGIGIEGCTQKTLTHCYPNNYLFNRTEDMHKDLTNKILSTLGKKNKSKLVKDRWER